MCCKPYSQKPYLLCTPSSSATMGMSTSTHTRLRCKDASMAAPTEALLVESMAAGGVAGAGVCGRGCGAARGRIASVVQSQ